MKTYPIVEITFSPTGGTKKVADQISCYLGNITNTVNLIRHDVSFSDVAVPSDSLAVIAAPVFEGVIPDIAIERMKEIQGNHANCVVIAVYGNRAYDDGLIQLKDTAELCGFNVIASVAAVAEHSIMRQFGSGRPDEEDSKELKKFAEEILEKLSSDKELSTDYFVPGSHEYKRLMEHVIHIMFLILSVKKNFLFFSISQVFTCGNQKTRRTARRITDDFICLRIHHFHHHSNNVPRCTKLTIYTCRSKFRKQVFIYIAPGVC